MTRFGLPFSLFITKDGFFDGLDIFSSHSGGSQLDCFVDLDVAGASAEIARERGTNLLAIGIRILCEQFFRRQQKSRCAITTLSRPEIGEGLLKWMQFAADSHALDCRDVSSFNCEAQHQTRQHRPAVNQNCANATLAKLAAMLGSGER